MESYLEKRCNNCKTLTPRNEVWDFNSVYQCCDCYGKHRCPYCDTIMINTIWFRWHCPKCHPERIEEDKIKFRKEIKEMEGK